MGRKIVFTLSSHRVTFSMRSGGSFSVPVQPAPVTEGVSDETAEQTWRREDAEERRLKQERRLALMSERPRQTFAEWSAALAKDDAEDQRDRVKRVKVATSSQDIIDANSKDDRLVQEQ